MAQAILSIDIDAITANWRTLDAISGAETGAVVKADCYGLGAQRVAPALMRAGVRKFFLAEANEGARIRQATGPEPEIFVFSGHMAGDAETLRAAGLTPMLNSPEQVRRHFETLPGHAFGVQLDSGMNRLGMEESDWRSLAPTLLAASPRLLMSHLACGDDPGDPMNAAQLNAFRRMTGGTGTPRSLAATAGILLGPDYHFEVTRPGIGLYGGAPFTEARPVVTLSLPVIQVRDVAPGETVGYSGGWTAARPSRIATLSSGYADGLIRAMTGRGRVFAGEYSCPLVGRVSMDLLGVDVTDLPEVPDMLDILGPHQGIDALSTAAGTISYEILTALGSRYARRYSETLA